MRMVMLMSNILRQWQEYKWGFNESGEDPRTSSCSRKLQVTVDIPGGTNTWCSHRCSYLHCHQAPWRWSWTPPPSQELPTLAKLSPLPTVSCYICTIIICECDVSKQRLELVWRIKSRVQLGHTSSIYVYKDVTQFVYALL